MQKRSAYPLPPSVNPKPTSEGDPFDKLPPDLQKVRLWLDVRMWEHLETGNGGPEGLLSWPQFEHIAHHAVGYLADHQQVRHLLKGPAGIGANARSHRLRELECVCETTATFYEDPP